MRPMDVCYRIDRERRLVAVSGGWNEFASANDASELCGDAVLGRRLLDFVAGSETKHLYDLLFSRVEAGHTVSVRFRCDAPSSRRHMRLTASPGAPEGIDFRVETLEVDERPSQLLLARHYLRDTEWVTICSWCKRVLLEGRWVEVEEAIEPLDLFARDRMPQLTHGLCASCTSAIRAQWEGA